MSPAQELIEPKRLEMNTDQAPSSPKRGRGGGDAKHLAKWRWQPGASGNPNGLKGLYGECMKYAREYSPEGIKHLIEIIEDQDNDPRVRTVAIGMILERAWGKPKEIQDDKDKPALDLSRLKASDLQALRGIAERLRGQDTPQTAPEAPPSEVEPIAVEIDGE